jgi:SAM-dependent methyltransferase
MHPAAYQWFAAHAPTDKVSVLDIGGRNINGTVRDLFTGPYTVLDVMPGPDVDIVADAATWTTDHRYDVVVCAEVFEHTPDWRGIIETAHEVLRPGGRFIASAAGPDRAPHSAHDGGGLRPGEYYANIQPGELKDALQAAGFDDGVIDQQFQTCDVRAAATKGDGMEVYQ